MAARGQQRAHRQQAEQRQQDGPAGEGQQVSGGRQPRQPGDDQQPQHPRQGVAAVGQAAQGDVGQREGRPTQQDQRDHPGDGRQPGMLGQRAVDVEHLAERTARLLDGPLDVGEHQAALGPRRLQRVLHPDVAQVDALQQRPRVLGTVVLVLAEDPHRWVVVDAERFLGRQIARRGPADVRLLAPADLPGRVADIERAEPGVLVELGHQVEPQRAVEQRLVIFDHHRIGQRDARQAPDGALAADHDVVGLVEPADDFLALFGTVGVDDGPLPAGHFGVVGAVGIATAGAGGQQVVPDLVDQQACPGADGAARPRLYGEAHRLVLGDRGGRQLDDDRALLSVQRQRVLHRRAIVDINTDGLGVVGRAFLVEIGIVEVVEAHGANDAALRQGEVQIERRALLDEQHPLQRQVHLPRHPVGRVVEQRGSAGHVVENPVRGGDAGHWLPVDARERHRPQQAGQ